MRVLFYGTPTFALPTIERLVHQETVVGVVTQPDRPAGRGRQRRASPVRAWAERRGLPAIQPDRLRDAGWAERLAEFRPDVAVVVAFGQILPPEVLAVPSRGSINVHASLLPRYRGAAPVAWSIIRGERETGITTFLMDAGLDTGPILLQRAVPIGPEETAGELAGRLADVGAAVLMETLDRLDVLTPVPQDDTRATFAPRLRKEDGQLDWRRPAAELAAWIRGLNPWPGAVTAAPSGRLLIWRARVLAGVAEPGTLVSAHPGLCVGTGEGLLLPLEVQPESRRAMDWETYLRGARLGAGTMFGAPVAVR
jgi:methionyl-tRNA formyltransferase